MEHFYQFLTLKHQFPIAGKEKPPYLLMEPFIYSKLTASEYPYLNPLASASQVVGIIGRWHPCLACFQSLYWSRGSPALVQSCMSIIVMGMPQPHRNGEIQRNDNNFLGGFNASDWSMCTKLVTTFSSRMFTTWDCSLIDASSQD